MPTAKPRVILLVPQRHDPTVADAVAALGVPGRARVATVTAGWRHLKFYFQIGLPTERLEDVDAIAELGEKGWQA